MCPNFGSFIVLHYLHLKYQTNFRRYKLFTLLARSKSIYALIGKVLINPIGGLMFSNKFTHKGFFSKSTLAFITIISLASFSAAASNKSTASTDVENKSATSKIVLDIYKNPSCGCCKKWINHIDQNDFQSTVHNRANLSPLKISKGIAPQYRSCHTAISEDGYVFEGHVPAKFIKQFLTEKPKNALGLSVPAMPIGTPGMEMGDLTSALFGTSQNYGWLNHCVY